MATLRETKIGDGLKIKDLPTDESWVLVTDSQEADHVRETVLGEWALMRIHSPHQSPYVSGMESIEECKDELAQFDSFFVKVGEGEYSEVWGFSGTVPYSEKWAYRLL